MSKKLKKQENNSKPKFSGFTLINERDGFSEFRLNKNGLTVLHYEMSGTRVVTTNITYRVGARDEGRSETGLAHMLEHMLFKPTREDLKNKVDSGAMKFERETGCILNANTWKDRTTYFFSYPKELVKGALHIEADRMNNVVLTDKEFLPERSNVLSEFDMNNGDPEFGLAVAMIGAAFLSHPYGHETIGFREDIEQYTTAQLQNFYERFYRPDNAVLMIFGDIGLSEALTLAKSEFSAISNPQQSIVRNYPKEPKQEGLRRVEVVRPSVTNLVSLGFKHEGFPSRSWYQAAFLIEVLTSGPESILHKELVDKGIATSVTGGVEPTSHSNLGTIQITLAPKKQHLKVEQLALTIINNLKAHDIKPLIDKIIENAKTDIFFGRGSSLRIAMELTEFVAADAWQSFLETEAMLNEIKVPQLLATKEELFKLDNMTIGYFIGKA